MSGWYQDAHVRDGTYRIWRRRLLHIGAYYTGFAVYCSLYGSFVLLIGQPSMAVVGICSQHAMQCMCTCIRIPSRVR